MPSAQDTFVVIVGNTIIALVVYFVLVFDPDQASKTTDPNDLPAPYITLEFRDRPIDIDFSRGDCVISIPGDCKYH